MLDTILYGSKMAVGITNGTYVTYAIRATPRYILGYKSKYSVVRINSYIHNIKSIVLDDVLSITVLALSSSYNNNALTERR